MYQPSEGAQEAARGWGAPGIGLLAAQEAAEKKKKGGGFQSMDLSKELLKGILHMGFNVPTPIQRKAIPPMMQGTDCVAMARTGSGKTAAYVIPMLYRLEEHSKLVGIRAVILSPTRELAIQIEQTVKRLGKFMTVKFASIVGGKGIEAQFTSLAMNPDIVIASPGRLLHLVEETGMKLSRVNCIILDEADRLFELGLQPQIVALMQRMPDSAQRALFSATMPSVLAEFTNAGLRNPVVIRLDAEMKLSDKLQQSSFVVRTDEKVAALIVILRKIIGVRRKAARDYQDEKVEAEKQRLLRYRRRFQKKHDAKKEARKKAKAGAEVDADDNHGEDDDEDQKNEPDVGVQALVFCESKHHVEFLQKILELYEIPTSGVHGHLDQEARRLAVDDFSHRRTAVMVVTDVAARGIDLPLLDNVVNYSFPSTPKLFIHRVGRVARAGRSGAAYTLFTMEDLPSYSDLMSFLDLKVQCSLEKGEATEDAFANMLQNPYDGYFGRLPEDILQTEFAYLSRAIEEDIELEKAFEVVQRAHKKFLKTKKKASAEGMRLSKTYHYETIPLHPVLLAKQSAEEAAADAAKIALRGFKAKETYLDIVHGARVFEVKKPKTAPAPPPAEPVAATAPAAPSVGGQKKKNTPAAPVAPVKKLSLAESMSLRAQERKRAREAEGNGTGIGAVSSDHTSFLGITADTAPADGDRIEGEYKDPSFFMSDNLEVKQENQAFSIKDATFDIGAETHEDASKARMVFAWNKRKSKFQKMTVNDAKALSKGIKNEAGAKIEFKKGKSNELYNEWMKKSNMRIQDVGEEEDLAAVERARVESGKHAAAGDVDESQEMSPEEMAAISAKLEKDPNNGKKLLIGRKMKRLPKEGHVRNFTEMKNVKDHKEKQQRKLEHRREKKRVKGTMKKSGGGRKK